MIQAPEITVPLSSLSCDIVVLDLGLLTLSNKFCRLDVNFSPEQSVVLYEQLDIKLEELNLYRYVGGLVRAQPVYGQWSMIYCWTGAGIHCYYV